MLYMLILIGHTMPVVDIYDKADLRQDASCWYKWKSLFESQCKLLIYMLQLIWDRTEFVDIYDLRHYVSCWYIW